MGEQPATNQGSKEKLIQAAIDLLVAKGFQSAGIREILENSGVTKSNFYYHFKSKEELCLTALDCIEELYFAKIAGPTLLDRSKSPTIRLSSYCDMAVRQMAGSCCRCGCPIVNLSTETSDFYENFREKISRIVDRQVGAIAECVRDGMASGEFRSDLEPPMIARFILAEVNGSVVLSKVLKTTDVLEDNCRSLMTILSA